MYACVWPSRVQCTVFAYSSCDAAIAVAEMLGVKHVAIIGGRTSLYVRGGLAGIMTFAWLVCFGVVVAGYNNNSVASRNLNGSKSAAQSVSAFSFFSIGSWVRGII